MNDEETLLKANEIAKPHGLRAEFLSDALSVGVQGDERTHTRVINVIGQFPGWGVLEKISTSITNATGVNRVTYEIEQE